MQNMHVKNAPKESPVLVQNEINVANNAYKSIGVNREYV